MNPSDSNMPPNMNPVQPVAGGQFPPTSPVVPPQRNKKKLFWIGGIVVLVLLIVGVIFSILPKSSKPDTQTNTTSDNSSAKPPAKTASALGEPVVCGTDENLCVPGIDINRDIVPKLKALGYTCAPDSSAGYVQDCKNNNEQEITFSNFGEGTKDTHVETVSIEASTFAVGTNPPDKAAAAWTLNSNTFHTVVSIIFAAYPKIQQNLNAWQNKQNGVCNYKSTTDHDTVSGYQLSCQKAVPIAVTGDHTTTTWTSGINLSTPFADE